MSESLKLKKLITVGDWSLDRYGEGVGICHSKCDSWMYQSASSNRCLNCEAPIPDDIYGLWLLYNWDKLENLL